jgi:hypothetical protein
MSIWKIKATQKPIKVDISNMSVFDYYDLHKNSGVQFCLMDIDGKYDSIVDKIEIGSTTYYGIPVNVQCGGY